MCSFQERNISSLPIWANVLTLQTAHSSFLILCQTVLHPFINFLISKQKRDQKLIQKCWSNRLVLPFLDMSCLLYKQIELYNQININKYLYCNELHLFSALFLVWLQWYTEQVFMFGMYLVPIYIYLYELTKTKMSKIFFKIM